MSAAPLDGVTVVSFEQAVAAPFASRQLADLGARVIKIEREEGDFARGYDNAVHGISSYFAWLNRSKESVVLDLKSDDGIRTAHSIIDTADVVLHNLAPGSMTRLGLGAAELRALRPELIHVGISGFGAGGPFEAKKAYDLLIQCEAGVLSVTGTPQSVAKVGISIADIAAGMYAYTAVLSAVIQRLRTGEGQTIEVSMLEALGEWMQQPALYAAYSGTPALRSGAAHATIAPYGPVECADGTIFVAVQNDREWSRLCADALHRTELIKDTRFGTNVLRVQNREALDDILRAQFSSLTCSRVLAILDAAGIASAELRDLAGFWEHPQLVARDRWREIPSPGGSVRTLVPPVSGQWPVRMGPVPTLGADTDRVVAEAAVPRSAERRQQPFMATTNIASSERESTT